MRKETLTYSDYFTGEETTEDAYFNLNKMELTEIQFDWNEDFQSVLKKIQKSNDVKLTIELIKKIITVSYGERVGNTFQKYDENGKRLVYKNFFGTGADDALFTRMMTGDGSNISDFIRDILPKDLRAQVDKAIEEKKEPAKVVPGPGADTNKQ